MTSAKSTVKSAAAVKSASVQPSGTSTEALPEPEGQLQENEQEQPEPQDKSDEKQQEKPTVDGQGGDKDTPTEKQPAGEAAGAE